MRKHNRTKESGPGTPLIVFLLAILLPLLAILGALVFYHTLLGSIVGQAGQDEARKSDAIIIFGAAITSRGRPSEVLRARIMQGLTLYRKGYAANFILTGGVGWGPPAESVVMRKILTKEGVPAENISLETRSRSTLEQVRFAARTMQRRGWKRALLVSDPLHMFRLKLFFSESGLRVFAAPTRTIRYSKRRRHAYAQLELLKLIAYYLLPRQG